jgi:hypothetical protein
MNPDRAIALILAVSLAVVLLLGVWLLRRAHREVEPQPAPIAAATAVPPAMPTATPGEGIVPAAARGYRLAGTVVGDLSYAILEDPGGNNQLYRPGQTIPGVGRLTGIEADRIILAGSDGTFVLPLASAPTATWTAPPSGTPRAAAWAEATPAPPSRRDPSEFESSP